MVSKLCRRWRPGAARGQGGALHLVLLPADQHVGGHVRPAVGQGLVDGVVQYARRHMDLFHAPGSGVQQAVAFRLLRRLAGVRRQKLLRREQVLCRVQPDIGAGVLQRAIGLSQGGLPAGVVQQDLGDLIHWCVSFSENAPPLAHAP